MRSRLIATLALAALAVLPAASCLSPTIPLPPPTLDTLQAGASADEWTVAGTCIAGATVTVLDNDTGLGAVIEDRTQSGTYAVTVRASACDLLVVTQEMNGEESGQTTMLVTEISSGTPLDPTACH